MLTCCVFTTIGKGVELSLLPPPQAVNKAAEAVTKLDVNNERISRSHMDKAEYSPILSY